ncbi:MAG TPA: DUF3300 domain-containing protein [Bryobacteraceae bacterium]|nr:DUF3300 domain-containing protein [Bryobacteraceae bacterium]
MKYKIAVVGMAVLLMFGVGKALFAQDVDADSQPPAQTQTFPPDQLAAMVAPIALYPDALLSQVLVASTYPLEVAEAAQWLRQNGNLQGQALVDAARQQNWDPSIQALVVFPDVINRLNSDIRWTTDLGNAFLAQQADVMAAVQRLRAEAQANGKLNSNAQETVTTQTQGDQTAIAIQPADPQVVYVPTYNPEYVWGPPPFGYYPPLYYPVGFGFGWGPGIYIGGFFGGLGWGAWGWGPNWFGGTVFVNGFFFNHYGYHYGFGGGRFAGRGVWAHDPVHRMGVAYSNRAVASRFGGNYAAGNRFASRPATNFAGRQNFGGSRFNGQSNAYRSAEPRSAAPRSSAPSQSFRSAPSYNSGSPYRSAQPASRSAAPSYRSAQPAYRSAAPSYRSAAPAYRSEAPSYRSAAPSYRSAAPSYHSAAPSYHAAPSGGFHSAAPSGGGFHGGGGGSHGGGGRR